MTWTFAVAGVGVAAAILIPLALKWQLPLRVVGVWIVVVGAVSGAAWGVVLEEAALSWRWMLASAVTVLAVSAVATAIAFFRDPDRTPPDESDAILSPADGTVVYVRQFSAGEVPPIEKRGRSLHLEELAGIDVGDSGHLIGIRMHLLNVHVNRAPIGGRVTSLLHTPGRFMSLRHAEATTVNERFTTEIDSGRVRVVVVQIASRLVRRIVSYLTTDQEVAAGQRIGMIKFGSQVDVILPRTDAVAPCVEPGDIVRAGVSILARPEDRGRPTPGV